MAWPDADAWVLYLSTAFGLQIFGYLLSVLVQSEVFYDLFGSITFVAVVLESYESNSLVSRVATLLVVIWASRLGSFLFFRVLKTGGDSRFDTLRSSYISFMIAWMMQGVWVVVTLLPVLILRAVEGPLPPRLWQIILGAAVWSTGFVLESFADAQKFAFKSRPENAKRIVDVGVWRWCKYPNYFGEIVVWCGVFITCTSAAHGLQSLGAVGIAALSPIFVTVLLCFVSGIPIQERQALSRWGDQWREDERNMLIPSWTMICQSMHAYPER